MNCPSRIFVPIGGAFRARTAFQAGRSGSFRALSFYSGQKYNMRPSALRNNFCNNLARTFRKFSMDPTGAVTARPSTSEAWKRLLTAGIIIGGTSWAISSFMNRETRNALSPTEREYLHSTYYYMGAGLGLTAAIACVSYRRGWTYRLMSMNSWAMMGILLVGSWGTMMATVRTDPRNSLHKHLCWASFIGVQAVGLGSLCVLAPQILVRAGLYTAGIMGALTYVGATAKEEKYLYLGGPLLCGMAIVALAAIAPLILPVGSRSLLMASEAVYMYGGLGVFSLVTLYHTQQILHHARLIGTGHFRADPCAESLALYLDFVNIFIRLVMILGGQQGRRR